MPLCRLLNLFFRPTAVAGLGPRSAVIGSCRLWLMPVILLIAAHSLFAQGRQETRDRVVVQRTGSSSRLGLSGRILDYTGEKLTIVTAVGNQVREIPAEEVVSVETAQSESHLRGLSEFARGKFDTATAAFEKALLEEPRPWMRREILALLIRCALKEGDYATAGSRFLIMIQSDPQTRHFHLIPLVWSEQPIDAERRRRAVERLTDENRAARLLGASVLLTDREYGRRALREMETLATDPDVNVRLAARMQLFRQQLREAEPQRAELNRWEARIETLPEKLRGGPCFLLARGYLQRREYDRAAALFLWLPLVYDDDHFLAAEACLAAGDAFMDAARREEALRMFREAAARFEGTPAAKEAARRLETMQTERPAG